MAEIKQVLGFDAQQAIQTLNVLDGALGKLNNGLQRTSNELKGFNSQGRAAATTLSRLARNIANTNAAVSNMSSAMSTVNGAAQAAATGTASVANAANQAGQALRNTGTAGQAAGQRVSAGASKASQGLKLAAADAGKFTTSLQLLSRIVFTQAIVRALSTLRNAFRAAGGEAVKFQQQLALIRTIDDSGRSLGQLSEEVRNLSDTYNLPLLEVAAGLYQTISNQVGDAGESLQFTAEASKFASSTNSTLADSVDLLSGALKSYNIDTKETDRVASVFFKTIDLGRITADELSNSFGRVGPAAADAGVELEEVGAALAAISVRGSNTPESLTQLRNIITAFIKPSDAMKKALRDMGFESGEAAIKTYGFAGVLREVAEATNGSSSAMAALFPNIRGLNGIAALTSDDLATLSANIDEMRVASAKFADERYLIATATDAQTVTSELNKLNNAIVVDLGQAFLELAANIIKGTKAFEDFIGVNDSLTKAVSSSGPALAGLATSLVLVAGAMKLAAVTGGTLSAALGAALLVPAAQGAGKSLGEFFDRMVSEAEDKRFQEIFKANAKAVQDFTEALEEADKKAADANREIGRGIRVVTEQLRKDYLRQQDIVKSTNDAMVKSTKASLNTILQAYDDLAEAQARNVSASRDTQREAGLRIQELQGSRGNLDFQQRTDALSNAQRAFAYVQRAAELASTASRTLAESAGDQSRLTQGTRQFAEANQAAAEAMRLAEATRDPAIVGRAFQQQKSIIDAEIRAQKTLIENEKRREANLENVRAKIQQARDLVREQAEIIRDNTGIFDPSTGKRFSDAAQAQRDITRREATKRLADISSSIDLSQLKKLGIEEVSQLEQAIKKDPIDLQFSIEQGTLGLQDALRNAFTDFRGGVEKLTGLDLEAIERAFNIKFEAPDDVFNFIDHAIEKTAELRAAFSQAMTGDLAQDKAREGVGIALDRLRSRSTVRSSISDIRGEGTAAVETYDKLIARAEELRNKQNLTAQDVRAFEQQARAVINASQESAFTRTKTVDSNAALRDVVAQLSALQQAQQQVSSAGQLSKVSQELSQFGMVFEQIASSGFDSSLQTAAREASNAATQFAAAQQPAMTVAQTMAANAASLQQAVQAYNSIATNQPLVPNGKALSKGGLVQHFANGGMARGMDTVPVMARQGESFINPKSTRQFFSQIQAINAGQQPVYRQQGGPISIGDINVTVQGGSSDTARGQASGRAIARVLEREVRRGTSRLPRRR